MSREGAVARGNGPFTFGSRAAGRDPGGEAACAQRSETDGPEDIDEIVREPIRAARQDRP